MTPENILLNDGLYQGGMVHDPDLELNYPRLIKVMGLKGTEYYQMAPSGDGANAVNARTSDGVFRAKVIEQADLL